MNSTWKTIIGIVLAGAAAGMFIVWVVYVRYTPPTVTPDTSGSAFGSGDNVSTTGVSPSGASNTELPVVSTNPSSQKVFKVAEGPIAGATLIDTTLPTSTIARFVAAQNGRVFDLLLDSQGAVPKAVSNTTIPGVYNAAWGAEGRGVILQYLDGDAVKTAHLSLPAPNATTSNVRVQFLPSGITSFALSQDGGSVAYLLKTQSGSDGYVARADGGDAKKLFSLPLSQIRLSWPSASAIFAYTAPATGVTGMLFSIDGKGSVTPLLSAPGITALGNRTLSHVLYQTASPEGRTSYAQHMATGKATPLSYDPVPELCVWSLATTTSVYCAVPNAYVPYNYLDLRHLGLSDAPMDIVRYDVALGRSARIATPGADGGAPSDIAELAVSKNDTYVLFIRKADRSLWAVRLGSQ